MKKPIKHRDGPEICTVEIDDSHVTEAAQLGAAVIEALQQGIDLIGANLTGANLSGANLTRADLRWADLRWADLSGANLTEANLARADLRWANLSWADLTWANLAGANLSEADLTEANLRWADFSGAIAKGMRWGELLIQTIPVAINGLKWPILIFDDHIEIGCELHTIEEWEGFDDRAILAMDGKPALAFWREWKGPIMAMAKAKRDKVGTE